MTVMIVAVAGFIQPALLLERLVGPVALLSVFFASAATSGVVQLAANPVGVNTASGAAICGMYGLLAVVVAIGMTFSFQPAEIHVPVNQPVTFRLTSTDVQHGFQIVGSNANAMIVPGYVTEFTTVFRHAGEYLIVCNEFCGVGHHIMSGKLIVEGS